ncbi:unnamed protein product [Hyaloperonospora brassicae]|uniref:Uncharacterized protein n=1 Tax=Hyaloperonospora brassicae TaxID=162125 RepID=A0AAV0U206_HYABA|nr:unnamed protein product [Hyaloperonospora brassicae]
MELVEEREILAYNICQNRSGYIYKNPVEMERLFGIRPAAQVHHSDFKKLAGGYNAHDVHHEEPMTYAKYHVPCMRNMLLHMTHILQAHTSDLHRHLPVANALSLDKDRWIFMGVGFILLMENVVAFFKVPKILRRDRRRPSPRHF